jgi:hypothetical protein
MKKLFYPFLILICISIVSCKKEVVPNNEAFNISSQSTSNVEASAVTDETRFGVFISNGTTDNKITIANKTGVRYVRASIILKDFKGNHSVVDKYMNNGFKVLLNLNWDRAYSRSEGRKPVPFPKDMVAYKKLLGKVLDKYKPEVAVIENEPTTDIFYSGPIEDYIRELAVAIEVCHSKGVQVADGAIHVGYVLNVMNGKSLSGKALEVKKLIEAYTTLNLDYVNLHTAGTGDAYPIESLTKVADYLRTKTGKPVMTLRQPLS